uniref:Uncharacterized protein n=1 Tax=Romanomermis culicivorax TaxID=13658 RepID=A0A915HWZ7_ROMCU
MAQFFSILFLARIELFIFLCNFDSKIHRKFLFITRHNATFTEIARRFWSIFVHFLIVAAFGIFFRFIGVAVGSGVGGDLFETVAAPLPPLSSERQRCKFNVEPVNALRRFFGRSANFSEKSSSVSSKDDSSL